MAYKVCRGEEMGIRHGKIDVGVKHNKLTAIKLNHRNKRGEEYWLWSCECGKEKVIYGYNVKSGLTKSCGCLYVKYTYDPGEKLNNLTIIGPSKTKKLYYECQCICGVIKDFYKADLHRGLGSCGCTYRKHASVVPESKYNKLAVIKEGPMVLRKTIRKGELKLQSDRQWECLCDCGTITLVADRGLKDGSIVSCGCYRREPKGGYNSTKEHDMAVVYGLELGEYLDMYDAQNGNCDICVEPLKEWGHIDHCHKTGKVRGILCKQCNFGLGLVDDSVVSLTSAIEYLKHANLNIEHKKSNIRKVREQNPQAACQICMAVVSGKQLHIDHCHTTNLIRDILCYACNHSIGHFKDNIENIQRAIDYLLKSVSNSPLYQPYSTAALPVS
jgi:hypothetical protein